VDGSLAMDTSSTPGGYNKFYTSPRMLLSSATCTCSANFIDARHNNLYVQNQSAVPSSPQS